MRSNERLGAVVIGLAVAASIGCGFAEDFKHKRKLEALVRQNASRDQVAQELGTGYTMYEKGTPSWDELQNFLKREPTSTLRPLRENVTKYSKVMYYTTMWRMTWIFFDDTNVMKAYYITSQ